MAFTELKERLERWEKESSRREKFLLIIISILLPVFLYYKFYYEKNQEKISLLKEDIKKLDLEIKKYEELVKREKEVEIKLREREKFLEEVKQIFPSEEEIPRLLKEISKLTKKNKLELAFFSPRNETEKDYYNEISFEIQFKGNYKDILNFLNEITKIPRLIHINKVEMAPLEKEERLLFKGTFVTFKYTGKPLEKKEKK